MGWKNLPRPGCTGWRIATRLAVCLSQQGDGKDLISEGLYHRTLTRNRQMAVVHGLFPAMPGRARPHSGRMHEAVIHLHPQAPAKPALGQPCNGCGACCALEPCPLGAVLSLRRQGACTALEWHAPEQRYRCGLLVRAAASGVPAQRLVSRWISAGSGCDATIELERPAATPVPAVPQTPATAPAPRETTEA